MKITKGTGTILFSACLALSLSACSNEGPAAATVNGVSIPEEKVTATIEALRADASLDTDEDWGLWLAEREQTPSSIRENLVNSFVEDELVRQEAKKQELTADSAVVEANLEEMKSFYKTEEEWQEALKSIAMTEEQYRAKLEVNQLKEQLYEKFSAGDEPSEEDILASAADYITFFDGAKKSSCIVFDVGDKATAQSVLAQINAGTLDFEMAAKEYSQDITTAEQGGNKGWDILANLDDPYREVLDGLSAGMVSELLVDEYKIKIIKCTEEFNAPEQLTSTDQIPEEFLSIVKEALGEEASVTTYNTWWNDLYESATIVINDMPEDAPYNIDMSSYSA